MQPTQELVESIDGRIAEAIQEIAALEAARAALVASAHVTSARAKATPATRRTSKPPTNGAAPELNAANDGTAPADASNARSTPAKARKPAPRKRRAKAKRPGQVLLAGQLEAILRESEDGLSATAIAKQANARYSQVLDLLRTMEAAGGVRRTESRRTSLWKLITDEEQIQARAAELESRMKSTNPHAAGVRG
jgi:predicted transcriptional regulator